MPGTSVLAAVLFGVGAVGLLIRRNVLVMFMCVELMLNAVNLTFITFARMLNDIGGQSSVFFVLVVAAAEVVVGLGIIVAIFRRRRGGHRRRPPHPQGLSRATMNHAADVILALPLAGRSCCLLVARAAGWATRRPGWLATLMAAGSFAATIVTFVALLGRTAATARSTIDIFAWVPVGGLHVNIALQLDPLSITMALFVTGVGSLIHLYSIGYMHGEDALPAVLPASSTSSSSPCWCLVLADNFLFCFLGWEGVGFCSYQLVAFWFERNGGRAAGKKAFVTNRVGDFGFMIGHVPDLQPLRVAHLRRRLHGLTARRGALARSRRPASLSCFFSAPPASRPSCRCTSGCPTPWRARRRSRP